MRASEGASDARAHTAFADQASEADLQPHYLHCVRLDCGHNENFRPRWRRGDPLDSVAREN